MTFDIAFREMEVLVFCRRLTQIFPWITDKHTRYALVTLHRPSNVDEPEMLMKIMKNLEEIGKAPSKNIFSSSADSTAHPRIAIHN